MDTNKRKGKKKGEKKLINYFWEQKKAAVMTIGIGAAIIAFGGAPGIGMIIAGTSGLTAGAIIVFVGLNIIAAKIRMQCSPQDNSTQELIMTEILCLVVTVMLVAFNAIMVTKT